jgi:glycosyltransferase involved in cell wall biosynthesis
MSKLVSVAIATYNGEMFLKKQIDSILSQTYKNIEIIVVDDCSSDRTIELLKEFERIYGIKLYLNIKNLGFIKNFEKAVSLCSGDYIALSDQDDIWLPNKIETLVNEIGEYSLVCSDAKLIDNNENIIHNSFTIYSGRDIPSNNIFEYLVFGNFVTGCTIMFDSKLVSKILPIPDIYPFHDWWFAIIASQSKGVKYIPDLLVKYRQHDNNVCGAGKKISISSFFNSILFKNKIIQEQNMLKNQRIDFLLQNKIYNSQIEKQFLQDAWNYTNLLVGKENSFKSVFFTFNYRKMIPQFDNIFMTSIKVLFLMLLYIINPFKRYIIGNKS